MSLEHCSDMHINTVQDRVFFCFSFWMNYWRFCYQMPRFSFKQRKRFLVWKKGENFKRKNPNVKFSRKLFSRIKYKSVSLECASKELNLKLRQIWTVIYTKEWLISTEFTIRRSENVVSNSRSVTHRCNTHGSLTVQHSVLNALFDTQY